MMVKPLTDALLEACPGIKFNEPLLRHTSLSVGGPADYYASVETLPQLISLRQLVTERDLPVFFIGAGSNLLVSDNGIRGLVIQLKGDFRKLQFDGNLVTVGAGVWMPTLSKHAAEHGLAGVESLVGVPGMIGGGLVMNAGTREGVLGDVVQAVQILDPQGRPSEFPAERFNFKYRESGLLGQWITGAVLRLKPEDSKNIMSRIDGYLQYRSKTQPIGTSNCGSVFKNPEGHHAAQLVEKAGLKGHRHGGVRVSDRHANFIVNDQNAKARDVYELIKLIQRDVFEKFAVKLEPEVKMVGEW